MKSDEGSPGAAPGGGAAPETAEAEAARARPGDPVRDRARTDARGDRRRARYAVETLALTKLFRSGRVQALNAVDLKVPVGAAFGLLGPNGAGKSTLVKILLSIVRPTAGAATIFGTDISLPEARRRVGYLPEGHRFPHYLTGRGVLEYFGALGGLAGRELDEQVEQKLALVGMSDWASTRVTRYSKGMLQRIGLAQAMLGEPKLVILDEPTDGVDPLGRHQMREVIKGLCRAGTTVFLNSHLLLEVEQVCNHIAIMHHGRIIKQGSIEEVRDVVRKKRALVEVRFGTGPLDGETRQAVEAIGSLKGPDGVAAPGFVISLEEEAQISLVIDALRERKVPIYSVEPSKVNLEDAFIELIDAEEDQGVGGLRA